MPDRLGAANWVQARLWRVIMAGLLTGLVAATGQPPIGLYPLGLIGLVAGFFVISTAATFQRAAWAGWALGAGYFAGTLSWIVQPFLVDVARHGWMAPFAITFLAGGLALFWALASGLAFWLRPRRGLWLAWAAFMALGEAVRGVIFTGFPWGGPATFWIDTPLMGLAGLIGASGMAALTFVLAAALVVALTSAQKARAIAATAICTALAIGVSLYSTAKPLPDPTSITLRLIQPNAPQHLKWHPDHVLGYLHTAMELSAKPAATPPDLIIWPETSVPYLLDRATPVLNEIAHIAAPAKVVLGIQRQDGGRYFNALVALDAQGAPEAVYDKHHLVPFGEYTPFGDLLHRFGIRGFAAQYGGGYTPGPGPQMFDLGSAGKALPLICYEAIFPGSIHATPERPDWLLHATNDAWFGTFAGPQQHLAQARLRAAEFGLPLARAANTGISAVIDARGQITAQLGLNETGFLDAKLPAALPATLYARTGDVPLLVLLMGIIVGLAMRRRKNTV